MEDPERLFNCRHVNQRTLHKICAGPLPWGTMSSSDLLGQSYRREMYKSGLRLEEPSRQLDLILAALTGSGPSSCN